MLQFRSFHLQLTVGAKNSAGFGTLHFLLTIYFAIWFIVHFTFQAALFLAYVCALHEHAAHTFRKLLKKTKSTHLVSLVFGRCT
jgi:hypothetical protein